MSTGTHVPLSHSKTVYSNLPQLIPGLREDPVSGLPLVPGAAWSHKLSLAPWGSVLLSVTAVLALSSMFGIYYRRFSPV